MPSVGSRRTHASKPARTSPHPPPGPPASPTCRSSSTPASEYAYRFDTQQATTVKRAAVRRLRDRGGRLAALLRAAVVVEDRYSQISKLNWVRPSVVADGLVELQVRWPTVPITFAETRQLAEERTYRYLAAAYSWAETERAVATRIGIPIDTTETATTPDAASPSTAEVRAWARGAGVAVSDRSRLHLDVWQAWREAHS